MIKLKTIDSTTAYVKRERDNLPASGAVIAEEQTGGKGQFGRVWVSPPGGLYLTVFYPAEALHKEFGLEVARILKEILYEEGVEAHLKWPNDLLINGKKVAGTLIECSGGRALIGIGLNVNTPQEVFNNIDQPATSLLIETGVRRDIESLAQRITAALLR